MCARTASSRRGQVALRGGLAGGLAAVADVGGAAVRGTPPEVTLAVTHLVALVLLGVGLSVATASRGERVVARVWLVLPSVLTLGGLLATRGLGEVGVGLAAGALAWAWWWPSGRGRVSVVVSAVAGTILGVRLAAFVVREYAGRDTEIGALVGVAAVALGAAAAHAGWHRLAGRPLAVGQGRSTAVGVVGLALLLVSVVERREWPWPAQAGSRDASSAVVIIVLDTVRADHLELYGSARTTMPALTRFAEQHAVVVDRAITNAPDSLAAHATLFTGRFPVVHGAHRPTLSDPAPPRYGYPLREDVPTLAELLGEQGFVTVGVSANFGPLSPQIGFGLDRGFDVYRADPDADCAFLRHSPWRRAWVAGRAGGVERWRCPVRYRRAEAITDEALSALDAIGARPFLLFVNYMDAHDPYAPPGRFAEVFPSAPDAPRAMHARNRYDGELRYLDQELDRLLSALRAHPSWNELVLVITSDHGEALGEHGLYGHTTSLYDTMIRVPLILKAGPSVSSLPPPGRRWNRPMQLADIAPLVLGALRLPAPDMDGVSPERPAEPLRAWSFPSRAQMAAEPRFRRELRAIVEGEWKLIEDHEGGVELYDLVSDPGELDDVAERHPDRVERLVDALGERAVYRDAAPDGGDELSEEVLERLRALGYVR